MESNATEIQKYCSVFNNFTEYFQAETLDKNQSLNALLTKV